MLCALCLQDLSYKDRHWHEACFHCSRCRSSLVDKPFAAKEDQVLCTDCYSQEYSSRCQECRKAIMPGGTAPTPLCPESLLHMPAGLEWLSEPHPCAGPVLKAWLQLVKHQE